MKITSNADLSLKSASETSFPVGVRQFEIGRRRAERQHGGRCQCHARNIKSKVRNFKAKVFATELTKLCRIMYNFEVCNFVIVKSSAVAKNIVYFDLETQKSADEVGGWGNISKMGMSIGVTFSTRERRI